MKTKIQRRYGYSLAKLGLVQGLIFALFLVVSGILVIAGLPVLILPLIALYFFLPWRRISRVARQDNVYISKRVPADRDID